MGSSSTGSRDEKTNAPKMQEGCHVDIVVFDVADAQEFLEEASQWRFVPAMQTTYISFTFGNNQEGGIWVHPGLAPRVINFYKVVSVSAYINQTPAIIPLDQGTNHPRDGKPWAVFAAPGGVVYGIHEE